MSDSVINATVTKDTMDPDHDMIMAVIGILSFFSVLGTVGNSMVLFVYVRKRNKLASTVFIITLACTDFVTCVVIIPYTMIMEYTRYFVKYDILCKTYMFLITSNVPFSAFIMMAIAVDRYVCICHPFSHILNIKRAKVVISLLALIAFILGIITALNYGVYMQRNLEIGNNTNGQSNNRELMKYYPDNLSSIKIVPVEYVNSSYFFQSYGRNNKSLDENMEGSSPEYVRGLSVIEYTGYCLPNGIYFTRRFTKLYQKVYSSFFVIVIVVVFILYVMIYRFVTLRRARRRRTQKSGYSSCRGHTTMTPLPYELQTRVSITNGCLNTELDADSTSNINGGMESPKAEKVEISRQMTIREKGLVANIRTAAMLFVVTAVFIVVFLPAWLMAHLVIPYNMIIFYMYFFYNVANPIIYAFMNKSFRRSLKEVIECRLTNL